MYTSTQVTKKRHFPLEGWSSLILAPYRKTSAQDHSKVFDILTWHKKLDGFSKDIAISLFTMSFFSFHRLLWNWSYLHIQNQEFQYLSKLNTCRKKQVHQLDQHIWQALQSDKIVVLLFYFSTFIYCVQGTKNPYFFSTHKAEVSPFKSI